MGVPRSIQYALFLRITNLDYFADRYARLALRQVICYRAPLSGSSQRFDQPDVRFRTGTPDDIARMKPRPEVRDALAGRLKNGDLVALAYGRSGEVCGYVWAALSSLYLTELGRSVELGRGEAWIYDLYVFPRYRALGLSKGLLAYMLGLLRERGFTTAYANIERDNTPSKKAFEKMGFRPYKETTYVRVPGRKWYFDRSLPAGEGDPLRAG